MPCMKIVNEIVTQHHRRRSTQISHKPVILGYIVAGFGWFCWWFWVVLLVVFGRFGWFRVLVTTRPSPTMVISSFRTFSFANIKVW